MSPYHCCYHKCYYYWPQALFRCIPITRQDCEYFYYFGFSFNFSCNTVKYNYCQNLMLFANKFHMFVWVHTTRVYVSCQTNFMLPTTKMNILNCDFSKRTFTSKSLSDHTFYIYILYVNAVKRLKRISTKLNQGKTRYTHNKSSCFQLSIPFGIHQMNSTEFMKSTYLEKVARNEVYL